MVNWSIDDAETNPNQSARSKVRRRPIRRLKQISSNTKHVRNNGRVRKVVNGQTLYLRVRKVVRN